MNNENLKLSLEQLNRVDLDTYRRIDKIPVVVILDDIRSAHNVGAIFRTSDAFRVEKIYLTGITPIPPNREIQKTALGAQLSVEWEHRKNSLELMEELQPNYQIGAIEQTKNSTNLLNFTPDKKKKYALIFGNEVSGVKQEIIDQSNFFLEIPQEGTKHSLNVSVCSGIVLWHFFQKY